MEKRILKRTKELARETKLPESIIQKIFESQFRMAREVIKNIDMIDMSEEEFNNTKTNFNWKYLGKFFVRYSTIKKLREKWKTKE